MRQSRKEKATDTARALAAARQVETRRQRLEKALDALAARRSSTALASGKRQIAE
jgi:hypothetical protein